MVRLFSLWALATLLGGCITIKAPDDDDSTPADTDTLDTDSATDSETETESEPSLNVEFITLLPTVGHVSQESVGAMSFFIDETRGRILVVAFDFDYPFYQGNFTPLADAEETITSYLSGAPYSQNSALIQSYPLLGATVTDPSAINLMTGEVTAILLEGDLQSTSPDHIWVAADGSVHLLREEGPYDQVDSNLIFREIPSFENPNPAALPSGTAVRLERGCYQEDANNLPGNVVFPCPEAEAECFDTIDNDADGETDCSDMSCESFC